MNVRPLNALLLTGVLVALSASGCVSTQASYADAGSSYGEVSVVNQRAGRASGLDLVPIHEAQPTTGQTERVLIRNASLLLEVPGQDDIAPAIARASEIVSAAGGYVAESSDRSAVLRIPSDQLDATLDQIAQLGKEVRRNVSANDMTMQYQDLQIRLENAKALQERLRQLLADAQNVTEAIAVETELSRVTGEVDRLEGQMRYLRNQIAFSSVRLQVRKDVQPGPVGWVFKGAYTAIKWLFVWD